MSDMNNNKDNGIDININKTRKISKKRRRFLITRGINIINVMVIGLIFVIGFGYLLFFKRETVSHEENRKLATLPKPSVSGYLDGSFTEGIAHYYDDTVHNRSKIKEFIASELLPLKGRKYGEEEIEIIGSAMNNNDDEEFEMPATEPATSAPAKNEGTTTALENKDEVQETTTTTAVPNNENAEAQGEIANNIVVVNNRGLMLYGGGKKNGAEYAASLNAYKSALGDNVNVYSMVCPTAVSYYMPKNYLDLTASEKDNIDNINAALVGVTPVNAYDALLAHKEEAIYSRTDHHWQPLGAYYAAQEFAKTAGVEFAELSEYETVSLPGYVGTLYSYTKSDSILNNPEDFIYYKPKCNTVTNRYSTSFTDPSEGSLLLDPTNMSNSSYYMVFGGDQQITHVATDCKNGRTLVIFKDSYGNALLPALTSSFENIYLCDIRYFDLNAVSFVQQVGATDLLFAMNTFSATGGNHDYVEINRTK